MVNCRNTAAELQAWVPVERILSLASVVSAWYKHVRPRPWCSGASWRWLVYMSIFIIYFCSWSWCCCFDRFLRQTASTSFGGKSNDDRLRVGKGVEWLVWLSNCKYLYERLLPVITNFLSLCNEDMMIMSTNISHHASQK